MGTDFSRLRETAERLQPFIAALFCGPRRVEDLPLLGRPVGWGDYLKKWEVTFKREGVALHHVLKAYDLVLERLFESQGAWCGARAYEAVETWLRNNTLTVHSYRPIVTTRTLLLAAAVHNWLWWYRNPDRGSSPAPGVDTSVKMSPGENLSRDVDPLLDALIRIDSSEEGEGPDPGESVPAGSPDEGGELELGDLVAMHLIAVNLTSLSEQLEDPWDWPHRARLETVQTLDALSRLVAAADGYQTLPRIRGGDWVGVKTLMIESGAAGIRQYLALGLGCRAMRDEEGVSDVLEVLATLHSLDHRADAHRWREGVQTFTAEVLRATFSGRTPEVLRQVWRQWSRNVPGRVSLAEWCGRVARRAELKSQTQRGTTPAELVWLWRELAMETLPSWINGGGEAILCWGLWLRGYLTEDGAAPRLTLTRIACRRSLEQLVGSWSISVRRIHQQATYGTANTDVANRVSRLKESLERLSAFQALIREELMMPRLAVSAHAAGECSEQMPPQDFPPNPKVKVYQYEHAVNSVATSGSEDHSAD